MTTTGPAYRGYAAAVVGRGDREWRPRIVTAVMRRLAWLLLAVLLAGCGPAATSPVVLSTPVPVPVGVLNPDVTQASIGQTVCVPGWTAKIRPPTSYTAALKRRQMAALHLPGTAADYEEDHTVPLSLGGAPRDPENLRPVPIAQARADDREETRLHAAVCAARMSLERAQRVILAWKAAHDR
jgi:hypothetical protein